MPNKMKIAVLGSGEVGKTIIDVTNPIAEEPPENGVLRYFSDINSSLMERSQVSAPNANFVKAFNSVGNAFMVNPQFADGKPTMFICGDGKWEGGKLDFCTTIGTMPLSF